MKVPPWCPCSTFSSCSRAQAGLWGNFFHLRVLVVMWEWEYEVRCGWWWKKHKKLKILKYRWQGLSSHYKTPSTKCTWLWSHPCCPCTLPALIADPNFLLVNDLIHKRGITQANSMADFLLDTHLSYQCEFNSARKGNGRSFSTSR